MFDSARKGPSRLAQAGLSILGVSVSKTALSAGVPKTELVSSARISDETILIKMRGVIDRPSTPVEAKAVLQKWGDQIIPMTNRVFLKAIDKVLDSAPGRLVGALKGVVAETLSDLFPGFPVSPEDGRRLVVYSQETIKMMRDLPLLCRQDFIEMGLNARDADRVRSLAKDKLDLTKSEKMVGSVIKLGRSLLGEHGQEIQHRISEMNCVAREDIRVRMALDYRTHHNALHSDEMGSDCRRVAEETLPVTTPEDRAFKVGFGVLIESMAKYHDIIQGKTPPQNEIESRDRWLLDIRHAFSGTDLAEGPAKNKAFWEGMDSIAEAIVTGTYLVNFHEALDIYASKLVLFQGRILPPLRQKMDLMSTILSVSDIARASFGKVQLAMASGMATRLGRLEAAGVSCRPPFFSGYSNKGLGKITLQMSLSARMLGELSSSFCDIAGRKVYYDLLGRLRSLFESDAPMSSDDVEAILNEKISVKASASGGERLVPLEDWIVEAFKSDVAFQLKKNPNHAPEVIGVTLADMDAHAWRFFNHPRTGLYQAENRAGLIHWINTLGATPERTRELAVFILTAAVTQVAVDGDESRVLRA